MCLLCFKALSWLTIHLDIRYLMLETAETETSGKFGFLFGFSMSMQFVGISMKLSGDM